MVIPTSIKLDVDTSETFNVVISNEGTEQDTISLIGIDDEGVTFTNHSPVTLDRGESQYVVMEVVIDSYLVAILLLTSQCHLLTAVAVLSTIVVFSK